MDSVVMLIMACIAIGILVLLSGLALIFWWTGE
jgi:hypothetical protein